MKLSSTMDSKIKNKLDRVFSEYIRKRDTSNGLFKCISCGKIKPADQCDCGHYINRWHTSVRWNEDNAHGECRHCNRFDENHILDYRRNLVNKIGEDRVLLLEAQKNKQTKMTDFEAEQLIRYYKDKIKSL